LEFQVIISHNNSREYNLSEHKNRLARTENLTLPLEQELKLLDGLSQFELGRFLLSNRGLNGYWTAYVILYSLRKESMHPLEHWMLNKAPGFKATKERFRIFQEQLQSHLQDNWTLASLPCGLMDDLLSLDYSNKTNINLVGIDLDAESLELAAQNAIKQDFKNVTFLKKDAWNLGIESELNMITSNGLNIYEPDDEKVTAFYQQCSKALKPNGIFITSFITPPPAISNESTWVNFNTEDLIKQKAIFNDILQVNWQTFRTEKITCNQLAQAGFEIKEVLYDSQGIFPTVVARKIQ
jgi:SAM-dependent methyltransferase